MLQVCLDFVLRTRERFSSDDTSTKAIFCAGVAEQFNREPEDLQ